MARRKERDREKLQRVRPFGISEDFNEVVNSYDISSKHHSANNLNALCRKMSSPSHREELQEKYGSISSPKPLLRRCQTSKPSRASKSARFETGDRASWRRNRDRVRKPSVPNVFDLEGIEKETRKSEGDFLRVDESTGVMDNTSSEKSSSSVSPNRLENNAAVSQSVHDNERPHYRSHSVVVFVEESRNTETTLADNFHSQTARKTHSLERDANPGLLFYQKGSNHNISPPILKKVLCEKDFCGTSSYVLQNEKVSNCTQTLSPPDKMMHIKIKLDSNLDAKLEEEPTDNTREGEFAETISSSSKDMSVNSNKVNISSRNQDKDDISETDSSLELQSYLGGNMESCI
jgi:hypothetical protein